jgi:hypothetical protein
MASREFFRRLLTAVLIVPGLAGAPLRAQFTYSDIEVVDMSPNTQAGMLYKAFAGGLGAGTSLADSRDVRSSASCFAKPSGSITSPA